MKKHNHHLDNFFSTPAWIYQMTSGGSGGWKSNGDEPWYPSTYRKEIEEDKVITWKVGKIFRSTPMFIKEGDVILFFFCRAGKQDEETGKKVEPGIYGWGSVKIPPKDREQPQESYHLMDVLIQPPSNFLKYNVLWDDEIKRILNEIRCNFYQATMWKINSKLLENIRNKIKEHLPGQEKKGTDF